MEADWCLDFLKRTYNHTGQSCHICAQLSLQWQPHTVHSPSVNSEQCANTTASNNIHNASYCEMICPSSQPSLSILYKFIRFLTAEQTPTSTTRASKPPDIPHLDIATSQPAARGTEDWVLAPISSWLFLASHGPLRYHN